MEEVSQKVLNDEMYDLAPCGFFTCCNKGLIVRVNRTFLHLTGYHEEELVGKVRWQELLTAGGKIYHETHFHHLLKIQGFAREINFDFKKKDGTRVPVLLNMTRSDRGAGREDVNYASVLDISQRKLYERELLIAKRKAEELVEQMHKKNRELEQFAYVVSHDLQSPLAALKGYLQLIRLKNEQLFSGRDGDLFTKVNGSINRMSTLIKELLQYSRLDAAVSDFKEVDLKDVWEAVLVTFEETIRETSAQVSTEALPVVKGNKTHLIRLFQNLLSNSLKYRHPERAPIIKLTVFEAGNFHRFEFSDNGLGFDQQEADKVFKFFERLSNTGSAPGSGIGMAATKKIVEMHGGQISVVAEKDRGATFVVLLPRDADSEKV